MKQDRFLIGILAGIGLLVLVAVGLFFARSTRLDYESEDIPEGILHNYLVAINKNDYPRAYSYLAEDPYKPTYENFRNAFILNWITPDTSSLSIGEIHITGDEATIEVNIVTSFGDPFSEPYRRTEPALLRRQAGSWKIRSMPNPYFAWDWYQAGPQVK